MEADRAAYACGQAFGRPREIELRAVLDAILYIARTSCEWRMLPKDFPPFTTVQGYFYDWRDNGLFEKINFELLLQAREAADRAATTRPRRSKAGSAILSLILVVCWSVARCIPPATSVVCRPFVRERSASPITRL
jgi:transposase